jgi:LacI family transcriptional regulator
LQREGAVLVPVGDATQGLPRDFEDRPVPTVLFGRTVAEDRSDSVTIDNLSAGYQATSYLIDLGHTRIGSVTGPLHLGTGRGRMDGMTAAMAAKGLIVDPR